MARIRTIKPEFFTSEDIVSLSPLARLLYIALWCEADREGRMAWKPRTFKMRYLPGDDCNVEALCSEIVSAGLVELYGDGLAYIPKFSTHQHVNPRESVSILPAPQGLKDALPKKVGKTLREAVFERDGYRCVRCSSEEGLEVDHILPKSCGGPHVEENLRTLCKRCNAGRPVDGKALEVDLASDGYSLKELRLKYGIDASIPVVHAQVGREGEGKERYSVPKGTGGEPPSEKSEDREKRELFDAGKSLLAEQGMPAKQTGSFIAKLAQDYGQQHALEAVRSAVTARPMGAVEYLKATCQRLKGERRDPITVASDAADKTAEYLAQQEAHGKAIDSPETRALAAAALASLGVRRVASG